MTFGLAKPLKVISLHLSGTSVDKLTQYSYTWLAVRAAAQAGSADAAHAGYAAPAAAAALAALTVLACLGALVSWHLRTRRRLPATSGTRQVSCRPPATKGVIDHDGMVSGMHPSQNIMHHASMPILASRICTPCWLHASIRQPTAPSCLQPPAVDAVAFSTKLSCFRYSAVARARRMHAINHVALW